MGDLQPKRLSVMTKQYDNSTTADTLNYLQAAQ
jgi:hypothetical protein